MLCEFPLGRAVENRSGRWPRLTDLKRCGREFGRDADAILLIHRPAIYDSSEESDDAYVITARTRFGRIGTTRLAYDHEGGFADYHWPSHTIGL